MMADDRFSDEASRGKVAIQCSHGDADMLTPTGRICNAIHHSSRQTNLLSVCSSHDSFSENEESKDTLIASDISEDTEMLVKVDTCQTVMKDRGFCTATLFRNNKVFLNQHYKQRELESYGDNISFISGSENSGKVAGDHYYNTNGKNVPCTWASVDRSPSTKKTVGDQSAFCCLARYHSGTGNDGPRNPVKLNLESLQTVTVLSNKSDLSEVSSLRDSYVRASSSKGEPSVCFEEQVESSLTRAANFKLDEHIHDVQNPTESMKPDIAMSNVEVTAEAAKCSDQKEHFPKAVVVTGPKPWKPSIQSQPIDRGGELDFVEDEVKVCDICGDVGREEFLASCSKCSDGAEHIYCMRVKRDKIPEGNWMCEECVRADENEKQKQDMFEKEKTVRLKQPLLNAMRKNSEKPCSFSNINSVESDIKDLGGHRSKTSESSTSHFSDKRLVDGSAAMSVAKGAFETSSYSSSLSKPSKAVLSWGSSFKNLYGRDMNTNCEGSLFRSRSFNSKVKFQQSKDGEQTSAVESVTDGNRKEGLTRMLYKSVSFNNSSSGNVHSTNMMGKKLCSNFHNAERFKRSRHGKGQNLIITKNISELHNPLLRSAVVTNCASASTMDKRILPHDITGLQPLSGSKYHSVRAAQGDGKPSISSKTTGDLTHRDITSDEERKFVNDARKEVKYSEAAFATKANNSTGTIGSGELSCLEGLPMFVSTVDIPPWISTVPQPNYIWQGGFEIQRSGKFLSSCHGIQAHLSTHASPKVLEVVHKLPQKILVEEVPRLGMWPTQFLESWVYEDNIALYFFAKDCESYQNNYKSLLDCMIKNDLGLKGNFGGIELLIFSSNVLPEKSQRWNKLFYLWGVLRGRRINCSQDMPSPQNISCSNMALFGSPNLCSSAPSTGILSSSNLSYHTLQTSNCVSPEVPRLGVKPGENEVSYTEQRFSGLQNSDRRLGVVDTPMKSEQLSEEGSQNGSSQREERDSKRRQWFDLNRECDMNGARVDEGREFKRMKSLRGTFECNKSSDVHVGERFPFGANGIVPGSLVEGAYYKLSAGSGSIDGRIGTPMKWQGVLENFDNQVEPEIPNLELSLGSERRIPEQGAVPSSPETMTRNKNDECPVSLSLSLTSSIDEEVMNKQGLERKLLGQRDVDTSLSLFFLV